MQEAVEMLKLTGKKVKLKVCRYMRGLKFEQQQVSFIKLYEVFFLHLCFEGYWGLQTNSCSG